MPVIEHDVHASVRSSANSNYGCWNRYEFKDGYYVNSRMYFPDGQYDMKMEFVPHLMSTECRFDHSLTDSKCAECKHRGSGERYGERVRREGLK